MKELISIDKLIYFSDEELEQLGYEQQGRMLTVAGEEYIIKRAVDNSKRRGYEVVRCCKD